MQQEPGIIRGTQRRRAGRDKLDKTTPIYITSVRATGTTLTVEYNQVVKLKGTPQYVTDVAGAAPVSATAISLTEVEIEFDADISLATTVTIPFEDAAVRNDSGGFATVNNLAVAA